MQSHVHFHIHVYTYIGAFSDLLCSTGFGTLSDLRGVDKVEETVLAENRKCGEKDAGILSRPGQYLPASMSSMLPDAWRSEPLGTY